MKRLVLLLAALLLAGCGGGAPRTTTSAVVSVPSPAGAMERLIRADPALAGAVRVLYQGSSWAVVQSLSARRASALAFHLLGGAWHVERSTKVKVAILGPQPGAHATTIPQVAIEITAKEPFVESALWVDGTELQEKGGGSPTEGTIYGAPTRALKAGRHIAVGYARTAGAATVVAWTFEVS